MTPDEMVERCAKCSNPKLLCVYGATRLVENALGKQKRKDAGIVKRMIGAGRHEIAATILAQEETP